MSSFDLKIDRLQVEINSAEGNEHRIGAIVQRAAALLAEQIDEQWQATQRAVGDHHEGSIKAAPLDMNLNNVTDEQASGAIANAWLQALAIRIGI